MRLRNIFLPVLLLILVCPHAAFAQQLQASSKVLDLPDKVFKRIAAVSAGLEKKLDKQTSKYLTRLERNERRLQKKLWAKDSAAAKAIFGDIPARYAVLNNIDENYPVEYSTHLDSMQAALQFMQGKGQQSILPNQRYQSVLDNYKQLQSRLNHTAAIKKYLKERQQYLKQQLQNFGFVKELKKFEKDVYYYRSQVNEYKRMLENPSMAEQKLLHLASRLPAFKEFFAKHSILSTMFRLPSTGSVASATPIPGLQTRAAIQQQLLQRFGNGPDVTRALQQNIQSAQAQLNQLKNKVAKIGGGSSDTDIPGFKPNTQKVKSFWRRIEIGINVQSVKANSYFPVTSDLALSAGYKVNDRSIIGAALSYKMGWGQSIRNIKLTHEGVGLRSFIDVKLKGSFYASGGFEYNYQQPFTTAQQLKDVKSWQQSGLLGISKTVSVTSKFFKQTKVQLLCDFLSYRQLPRSQPIKFRIGYNLN